MYSARSEAFRLCYRYADILQLTIGQSSVEQACLLAVINKDENKSREA